MPKSKSTKSPENHTSSGRSGPTPRQYALAVLKRPSNPERKEFWRSDVKFARYISGTVASGLASRGPISLDERSTEETIRIESADQIPAFVRKLGSAAEWQNAFLFVSELAQIAVALLCSADPDTPGRSDMLAMLRILCEVQTRILAMLETKRVSRSTVSQYGR